MTVERIDFYEDGTCEVVPATPDPIPEGFAELDAYATETHGEHWTVLSQKEKLDYYNVCYQSFVDPLSIERAQEIFSNCLTHVYEAAEDYLFQDRASLYAFLTVLISERQEDYDVRLLREARDYFEKCSLSDVEVAELGCSISMLVSAIQHRNHYGANSGVYSLHFADQYVKFAYERLRMIFQKRCSLFYEAADELTSVIYGRIASREAL